LIVLSSFSARFERKAEQSHLLLPIDARHDDDESAMQFEFSVKPQKVATIVRHKHKSAIDCETSDNPIRCALFPDPNEVRRFVPA
jgi:hypothetical protein